MEQTELLDRIEALEYNFNALLGELQAAGIKRTIDFTALEVQSKEDEEYFDEEVEEDSKDNDVEL